MRVDAVFDFDAREHYRAARAVTRLTAFRYIPWAAGAVSLLLVLWNVWRVVQGEPVGEVLPATLPWLVLFVFWAALFPFLQRRASRRLPANDASLKGPQLRSVDADGYHSRGNDVALDIPWKIMLRAVETDEFFLFFINKQCAYYIPRRALTDSQSASVRQCVRDALGSRAQLKDT